MIAQQEEGDMRFTPVSCIWRVIHDAKPCGSPLIVGFLMMEPVQLGLSSRFGMNVCICLFLVVGDIPVNSEGSVVTSSTSKFATQSFKDTHR
jgi:hypothetical protein